MSTTGDHPKLTVSNFGPIQQAEVELHPLSVFIGPSNTGKSYLAILIYALHCYFNDYTPNFFLAPHRELHSSRDSITQGILHDLQNIVDNLRALHERDILRGQEEIVLPEQLAATLRKKFRNISGTGLEDEIGRCFGLEAKSLRRWDVNGDSHIILRAMSTTDGGASPEHHLALGSSETAFQTIIPEGMVLRLRADFITAMSRSMWLRSFLSQGELFEDSLESGRTYRGERRLLTFITKYLAGDVCKPFAQSAYYLPADRTGIMHAHKAVVSAALGSIAMTGIDQIRDIPLLSGIIVDFLKKLITIDDPSLWRRDTDWYKDILEICEEIEDDILNGSIKTERSETTNYPQFGYRQSGWTETLPLNNASSMVSELAPVLLYLRHQVSPGDVLIIEEPESHLHPSMQVQFTRQLAAMVNAGIRIIITTHSEWVLEELANLVRLSFLPTPDRDKIAGGGVALHPDKVGAWLFQQGTLHSGSTVSQIDLDESGLYPTGFDDVATILHNNWARISRQLDN